MALDISYQTLKSDNIHCQMQVKSRVVNIVEAEDQVMEFQLTAMLNHRVGTVPLCRLEQPLMGCLVIVTVGNVRQLTVSLHFYCLGCGGGANTAPVYVYQQGSGQQQTSNAGGALAALLPLGALALLIPLGLLAAGAIFPTTTVVGRRLGTIKSANLQIS